MNARQTLTVQNALMTDPRKKAWIQPNQPLFVNSTEHADMFLTTYRLRNAYEELLEKLAVGERVADPRDLALVQRLFDMEFYPPRKMNLRDWKDGKDPIVRILSAFKDTRWKRSNKRPHEITLELDNGKAYQINPNDSVNKFLHIRANYLNLEASND